jgi:hypothetical protein
MIVVTEATKDLLKRALELPVGERVKLAREILESVDAVEDEELELEPEFEFLILVEGSTSIRASPRPRSATGLLENAA